MGEINASLASEEARAEYAALRAESDRRSTTQQALVVLELTAVVAILAAAVRGGTTNEAVSLLGKTGSFYLLALIPLISFSFTHLWLDHDRWIDRIGRYIRLQIEPGRAMNWQTELQACDDARQSRDWGRYGYVLAHWCIFTAPSVFVLVALALNASGALEWTTVGADLVLVIGTTGEWMVRAGRRRSKGARRRP